MKRKVRLLPAVLFLTIFLAGCGIIKMPQEGECVLVAAMENNPVQIPGLSEAMPINLIEIVVRLKNITTEKEYELYLNPENGFSAQVGLNPGIYQVEYCRAENSGLLGMEISSEQESVELTREMETKLDIFIENLEECVQSVQNLQVTEEILAQERFSRQVWLNGQMIPLENILECYPFTSQSQQTEELVEPYEKMVVTNAEQGIRVTVLNEGSEAVSWKQCKVSEVDFNKNNVVFGGGVSMGMPMSFVCHAQDGIYGTPDKMEGTPFRSTGLDSTALVYQDTQSGDRLTFIYSPWEDYMIRIAYEFEQFE